MANSTNTKQDPNPSTKIFNRLEELFRLVEENNKNQQMQNTEIIKHLATLETKIANGIAPKSRTGGKAGAAAPTADKRRFPINKLAWLKGVWRADREGTTKQFFTDDQINELDKFMATDPKAKILQDDARKMAEVTYLWKTFISPPACKKLMEKLGKVFEERKAAFEASNKTPASKEDDPAADEAASTAETADE